MCNVFRYCNISTAMSSDPAAPSRSTGSVSVALHRDVIVVAKFVLLIEMYYFCIRYFLRWSKMKLFSIYSFEFDVYDACRFTT